MGTHTDTSPNFALHQRLIEGRAHHLDPKHARHAWRNQFYSQLRQDDEEKLIAVGYNPEGKLVEMIALDVSSSKDAGGNPLRVLYHVNWATKKFLQELGLPSYMAEI
ncbi:hypothetical protein BLEM_2260 [Bifidobacterium lemurum]|uniref:Uncharacterized protein n=1 Tax=Bifidobacterium lemurum TaxID=1603886 RepID=A0A261FIM8_9BIFI|nr:hypothetical protein [Bifidobacterium lemurum]OZG59020.1 hypothetical protein BLEM_2306 [Bifidobacterium lemurum]OZG59785.1 hypothetical protein BLEM_2260 [Bifidobacterium lemurum]QOL35070.1 hypothetical protein BL8807_04155 [Bifidobacterium lemurum]